MPCAFSAGTIWASAASTCRVVCSVLAPYWLASDKVTPGRPITRESPKRSWGSSFTVAMSAMVTGMLLRTPTMACATAAGSGAGTGVWISTR